MKLHVGVLHYTPSCESFPLLADPVHYTPDTQDIHKDREEMNYWLGTLQEGLPTLVAKASASEHNKPGGGGRGRGRGREKHRREEREGERAAEEKRAGFEQGLRRAAGSCTHFLSARTCTACSPIWSCSIK